MKRSIGPETYLYPLPSIVVGTYDKEGRPNLMTASWSGVVNSDKPMISVSMRKATYSHDSMIASQAFTISVPKADQIIQMDYIGTRSGAREDKFAIAGLTPVKSDLVNAPYAGEFPITMECRLVKYDDLGLHTMFIGEVLDVKIEEGYETENGKPDMAKINPVAYAHGDRHYYEIGKYLGRANFMWQTSSLNMSYSQGDKKEVLELVNAYYHKLDNSYPMEDFDEMIDWENFVMDNGQLSIDSREKYVAWYDEVTNNVFNRKHIIEKISIKEDDGAYYVHMDMFFRANTWEPGEAKASDMTALADIDWKVRRNEATGKFVLEDYRIVMK